MYPFPGSGGRVRVHVGTTVLLKFGVLGRIKARR
jgi:hypothetical protein